MRTCTATVAALLLLLTACQTNSTSADPSSGQATPSSGVAASHSSATAGSTAPANADPGASAPSDGEPSGPGSEFRTNPREDPDFPQPPDTSELVLSGARLAQHEGYDRVVFDLSGQGVPGYRVEYVDTAIADGSGAEIPLHGTAILRVILTGVGIPAAGDPAPGATPIGDLAVVADVNLGPPFEGQSLCYIGVTEKTGFRAFTLQNPSRLVVDIQHR